MDRQQEKDVISYRDKVSNISQIGGIETSILDNGIGRGNRIAWFNTGGGLRFKVNIDRAMDIGEAFYNQYGLAWVSHQGFGRPQPWVNQGIDWLRNFGGGLLTTCGLTHVGGPENDDFGQRGLHGEVSNIPTEIVSIVQPDLSRQQYKMSITGRILESSVFASHVELRRTLSADLFSSELTIEDEVTNLGNTTIPHMLLYHFNFGYPLIDEGVQLVWNGETKSRGGSALDDAIFASDHDYTQGQAVLQEHSGFGEAAGFIDPQADDQGLYHFGIKNSKLNLSAMLTASKDQMPALTNWQHWGKREYVVGLEPGTNYPIGQQKARAEGSLLFLEPGQRKNYKVVIRINND